jgi:LysM repeat protein
MRLRSLVVASALVPALAAAQQPAPAPAKTHTVKRGDTLWDLAQTYLGDPFLWPEIYRLNTAVVEDPHWIYPGEVLTLPDAAAVAAGPAAPADAPRGDDGAPVGPGRPGVDRPDFNAIIAASRTHAVRAGEYLTAPFVAPLGGLVGAGRVVRHAETQVTNASTAEKQLLQFQEVFVAPPAGAAAVVGDRYLAVRQDAVLPGVGRVMVPTAVIEVVGTGAADGSAVRARATRLLDPTFEGYALVPIDTLALPSNVFPAAVPDGKAARVLWMASAPELPSIGQYLVLDLTARDGVVTGDQVTLFRSRAATPAGAPLPDERIGVAQVLRVTPQGASAIVIGQRQLGIQLGMPGRVTARMP